MLDSFSSTANTQQALMFVKIDKMIQDVSTLRRQLYSTISRVQSWVKDDRRTVKHAKRPLKTTKKLIREMEKVGDKGQKLAKRFITDARKEAAGETSAAVKEISENY